MKPLLSVIIPTCNRAGLLKEALTSLEKQTVTLDSVEVLVIDNGSTDCTRQMVASVAKKLPNLHYCFEASPGLHSGRHRGLNEAQADILVYADDDIEAFPSWLSSIYAAFQNPEVVLVGGNILPAFVETPPTWLLKLWEQPNALIGGRALPPLSILELNRPAGQFDPYYVWGCNFSIRKSTLLAAGGFHPDGMPRNLLKFRGDGETHVADYVARQGLKCFFHPEASIYHKITPERMKLKYFRERGFREGVSNSFSALRSGSDSPVARIKQKLLRLFSLGKLIVKQASVCDNESLRALITMEAGLKDGYLFHQKEYRNDPQLQAWVHKKDYFSGGTDA